MDVLISLIMVAISQYIPISNHHIVHLKYSGTSLLKLNLFQKAVQEALCLKIKSFFPIRNTDISMKGLLDGELKFCSTAKTFFSINYLVENQIVPGERCLRTKVWLHTILIFQLYLNKAGEEQNKGNKAQDSNRDPVLCHRMAGSEFLSLFGEPVLKSRRWGAGCDLPQPLALSRDQQVLIKYISWLATFYLLTGGGW